MTVAATLTYDTLTSQLISYTERPTDTKFIAQIPYIVMMAENRIATDLKQQGFQAVVKGTFTASSSGASFAKPAYWRETISFNYKTAAGWQPLRLRSLEYLKNFWPMQSTLSAPRFYADYNFTNFLVAPSPDQAYDFELAYYARLDPLSTDNPVNWLTVNAPQCLMYAALLEAYIWTKNSAKVAEFQAHYDSAKAGLMQETAERLGDRSEVVTRG
jgi:hypothetical protein